MKEIEIEPFPWHLDHRPTKTRQTERIIYVVQWALSCRI
jgi:hypothetical protein